MEVYKIEGLRSRVEVWGALRGVRTLAEILIFVFFQKLVKVGLWIVDCNSCGDMYRGKDDNKDYAQ